MNGRSALIVVLAVALLVVAGGGAGPTAAPASAQLGPSVEPPPPSGPNGGTPDLPGVVDPGTGTTDAVPAAARVTVTSLDTAVGAGVGDLALDWSVLVEHVGTDVWPDVEVTARLHAPVGSRSALRAALAGGSVPAVLRTVTVPGPSSPLGPGGAVVIAGTIDLTGIGPSDLGGIHPLRLQVLAGGAELFRIDTAVVRLQVPPPFPLATTFVWPVSDTPARGPDGLIAPTFDVTTAPGGRLATLITTLERGGVPPLVTIAPAAHLVEDLARRATAPPLDDTAAEQAPDDGSTRPNGARRSDGTVPTLDGAPTQDTPAVPGSDAAQGGPGAPDGAPPADTPTPTPEASPGLDAGAEQAARLLDSLRRAVQAALGGPARMPYAEADLGRLLAGDASQRDLAARAVLEGGERLAPLLGRTANPATIIDGPVTPQVLDLLPDGVVLLAHAAVVGPDLAQEQQLGEPVRDLTAPSGRQLTGIVADPFLSAALVASTRTTPGDPVLAAHHVLVDTAMVLFEAPGRGGRSLLLMAPADFDPDPRFAAALLDGFARAQWLRPSTPSGLLAATQGDHPTARLAPADTTPLSPRLGEALTAAALDLSILAGAVDLAALATSDPSLAVGGVPAIPLGPRTFQGAEDELLRATSRRLLDDSDLAVALVAGVQAGVDVAFGTVRIEATDLTLTDREGTLPITLAHVGGVPIRVRLEVDGPAAIAWTSGTTRDLTLTIDAGMTIELPLRTGSTGQFPVSITVTDPSGRRTLASETLSVRGTAVSGPALSLIGSAIAALTIVGTIRQRRRGRPGRHVRGQPPR